jgi:hypothetical protein
VPQVVVLGPVERPAFECLVLLFECFHLTEQCLVLSREFVSRSCGRCTTHPQPCASINIDWMSDPNESG